MSAPSVYSLGAQSVSSWYLQFWGRGGWARVSIVWGVQSVGSGCLYYLCPQPGAARTQLYPQCAGHFVLRAICRILFSFPPLLLSRFLPPPLAGTGCGWSAGRAQGRLGHPCFCSCTDSYLSCPGSFQCAWDGPRCVVEPRAGALPSSPGWIKAVCLDQGHGIHSCCVIGIRRTSGQDVSLLKVLWLLMPL